jgi:hypothetical protein
MRGPIPQDPGSSVALVGLGDTKKKDPASVPLA